MKENYLDELKQYLGFIFIKGNITDKQLINDVFTQYQPQIVVNLAAQAGVLPWDYDFEAHKELVPV